MKKDQKNNDFEKYADATVCMLIEHEQSMLNDPAQQKDWLLAAKAIFCIGLDRMAYEEQLVGHFVEKCVKRCPEMTLLVINEALQSKSFDRLGVSIACSNSLTALSVEALNGQMRAVAESITLRKEIELGKANRGHGRRL